MDAKQIQEIIIKISSLIRAKYKDAIINSDLNPVNTESDWPVVEIFNIPDNQIVPFDRYVEELWAKEAQPFDVFIEFISHTQTATKKYYEHILGSEVNQRSLFGFAIEQYGFIPKTIIELTSKYSVAVPGVINIEAQFAQDSDLFKMEASPYNTNLLINESIIAGTYNYSLAA